MIEREDIYMKSSTGDGPDNRPLVSIVTPSFNSYPYIQETVESVRIQDYPHIEHIVIDGGSSDGTVEFLQSQPHLVWVSEPDRGQSHALNKGFRSAKGEIIGWLNADDSYQPGAVSTAVRFLMDHRDVDLIYSDLQIIDEDSQPVGITKAQPFDLNTFIFSNYINQPTVFMRRRVIEKLGGVDENLHYTMDRELWLRAGLVFNMRYLQDQVLANFRLCRGTKSFELTPGFRVEWLNVMERAFQTPSFSKVPQATKRSALQKIKAQFHMGKMIKAIEQRDRKIMIQHLIKATTHDPHLIFNRGTWLFAGKGLLGLDIDRLRKYRK